MSCFFRYNNGYIGTVSEQVGEILEAKGQGVVQRPKPGMDMESFVKANNRDKGNTIETGDEEAGK